MQGWGGEVGGRSARASDGGLQSADRHDHDAGVCNGLIRALFQNLAGDDAGCGDGLPGDESARMQATMAFIITLELAPMTAGPAVEERALSLR